MYGRRGGACHAGCHGKGIAVRTVRAWQHRAVRRRHGDHAQAQRFAQVFFQVGGQLGVGVLRFQRLPELPVFAVLVFKGQRVMVQGTVRDARPGNLIAQSLGIGAVGQQDAVRCAGLGQAGADVRVGFGRRSAHSPCVGGYTRDVQAHGGIVPVARAVFELIHLDRQLLAERAVRGQVNRIGGQFNLLLCAGGCHAVQLVGIVGRTGHVLPGKGIQQVVVVQRIVGRAQNGGGQNGEVQGLFFAANVGCFHGMEGVLRVNHLTVAVHLPHILNGVGSAVPHCAESPAADRIALAAVDRGCHNAPIVIFGQGIVGQVGKGHMGSRAGQNRFDRLQGDKLVFQALSAYRRSAAVLASTLQHNAVLGVILLACNAQVCVDCKVLRACACNGKVAYGQVAQVFILCLGNVAFHIVSGRLHPIFRLVYRFYRGTEGKRLAHKV